MYERLPACDGEHADLRTTAGQPPTILRCPGLAGQLRADPGQRQQLWQP